MRVDRLVCEGVMGFLLSCSNGKCCLHVKSWHVTDLLPGIWVPDQHVRNLRAIVAQRRKQVNLITVKCEFVPQAAIYNSGSWGSEYEAYRDVSKCR